MNLDQLKEALRPWMRVKTWNTGHPNDDERFHHALKTAFDRLGINISGSDFSEAMMQLANELYPDWIQSAKRETVKEIVEETAEGIIDEFAKKAENISLYLKDTKGRTNP